MDSSPYDLLVIGGGAAGYFGALRAAGLNPALRIAILEGGNRGLEKVRISGGGRCNVTHACFDPAELVKSYPRGSQELRGPLSRFQPRDTVQWFTERGVALKTEPDGRMFPVSDTSEIIVGCLERACDEAKIKRRTRTKVTSVTKETPGSFEVALANGDALECRTILLATGGSRSGHALAAALGHTITPLAPSLFTFKLDEPELLTLSGLSCERVSASLRIDGGVVARSEGPLLITHWGVSGPAILRLSAIAARELAATGYRAHLVVNWRGGGSAAESETLLLNLRHRQERKLITNTPLPPLPHRLWHYLVRRALGDEGALPWCRVPKRAQGALAREISESVFEIVGKGEFKEEFVTCGGVSLREVDMRTMESKLVSGLYFAGEILDIDGVTGGFNFQNAWTTGWIAGTSIGAPTPR